MHQWESDGKVACQSRWRLLGYLEGWQMQSGLKNREASLEELSISLEMDSYNWDSSLCSSHKPVESLDTRMMLDNRHEPRLEFDTGLNLSSLAIEASCMRLFVSLSWLLWYRGLIQWDFALLRCSLNLMSRKRSQSVGRRGCSRSRLVWPCRLAFSWRMRRLRWFERAQTAWWRFREGVRCCAPPRWMDQLSGSRPTSVLGLSIHHALDFDAVCGQWRLSTNCSGMLRESWFVLGLMNECRHKVTPTYWGHLLMEFLKCIAPTLGISAWGHHSLPPGA